MMDFNVEPIELREPYDEYHDPEYIPAPCQQGCPLGTDIPSYVGLIWQGNFEAAFEVISAANPFSSICGRVCAKPCEAACRRGESDGSVAIRNLKRFAADQVSGSYRIPAVPVTRSKSVGIIGGGPCGLTAAQDLAEAGYEVHVYEKSENLGGMMTSGIPVFRLPRLLIERDINRLLEHCPGIEAHLNCALGEQVSLRELKERHDAVLLATGLWKDRGAGIPGEEPGLDGLYGIGFLTDTNRGKKLPLSGGVVVVGGGNVAIDVARTALRAGAEEVQLFCLETRTEMPAWKHEIKEALDEGIVINNSWGPKRILNGNGKVTGIEFMRCASVFDAEGCFSPQYDPKTTRTVLAQAVLMAIGLTGENKELEDSGIMVRGRLAADFDTMRTPDPKVFAAGDAAFGPSAVVYAIHQGHRAAHYVKAFLEGQDEPEPYRIAYNTRRIPPAQDPMWERIPREEQACSGLATGLSVFGECELTYDAETARRQAARCLRCDAETGTADYSRRTREHIHAMARIQPGDTKRLRDLLRARLRPRDNPFPPERPGQLDDLVFLPAALTRLVIDPYREHCSTATQIGKTVTLKQPYFFTGFDEAAEDVREALAGALAATGCGYIGSKALVREAGVAGGTRNGHVPWLQIVVDGTNEPDPEADGLIHVIGPKFRPISIERVRRGQLLGVSATAAALPDAIPYALENGLDFVLLDAVHGLERPWAELESIPDLTVMRDAIGILRKLNREEDIALLYFGGLRSGTDVAKVLAVNCNAGIFGVAMGIAMGGAVANGRIIFGNGLSVEERRHAAENWIRGSIQETAIIARCAGKTNVHNLEPEDMRTITLAASEAVGVPLASGRPPRDYF